jgi:hypothetical protein
MTTRREELLDNLKTCEEMASSTAIAADRSAWLRLAEMWRRLLGGAGSVVHEDLATSDQQ